MYIKLPKILENFVLHIIGYDEIEKQILDYEQHHNEIEKSIVDDNIVTKEQLKKIEDDWVECYLIN